jgi:hypothetical protein
MMSSRRISMGFYTLVAVVVAATVAACGPSTTDPGPGGVNAGDAKALDEAAKKLDERQTDPGKDK